VAGNVHRVIVRRMRRATLGFGVLLDSDSLLSPYSIQRGGLRSGPAVTSTRALPISQEHPLLVNCPFPRPCQHGVWLEWCSSCFLEASMNYGQRKRVYEGSMHLKRNTVGSLLSDCKTNKHEQKIEKMKKD
jgi:hypothetical protein